MPDLVIQSCVAELEKIAMARIGFQPGGHVALRMMQRAKIPRGDLRAVEKSLKQAFREPGGMKHLGSGDFFLPVGDKGTVVFTRRGDAGHVVSTFLGPGMKPRGRHIDHSNLNANEVAEMTKRVNAALTPGGGAPPTTRKKRKITTRDGRVLWV